VSGGSLGTIAGKGGSNSFADGDLNTGKLANPAMIAVDSDGNIIIADVNNNRIRILAKTDGRYYGVTVSGGNLGTIAGTGSLGSSDGRSLSGTFTYPSGVCIDSYGNIIIADTAGHKIRILAKTNGPHYGVNVSGGNLGTIAGTGSTTFADGPLNTGTLNNPVGVCIDSYGNIIIADADNRRIRILARTTGKYYGVNVNENSLGTIAGIGGASDAYADGALADARLSRPWGVAVDALGNIIVADRRNFCIRIIPKTTGKYYGVNVNEGSIGTIAGIGGSVGSEDGSSTAARFSQVMGLAIESNGDIFIADYNNGRTIRKLTSS